MDFRQFSTSVACWLHLLKHFDAIYVFFIATAFQRLLNIKLLPQVLKVRVEVLAILFPLSAFSLDLDLLDGGWTHSSDPNVRFP